MAINAGIEAITKATSHQNTKDSMFKSSPKPGNHQLFQEAALIALKTYSIEFICISACEI